MTDPVIRDIDVVSRSGAFGAPETATHTASGQTITVLNRDTSGNGSLSDELLTAGANSTVILSGTINTTATSSLQQGQTLMGAGTLAVRSPSGRVALLTTQSATVARTGNGSAITANNSNVTVTGLNITHSSSGAGDTLIGFNVGGANNVIANNTVSMTASGAGSTATGVSLNNNQGLVVSGNVVTVAATSDARALNLDSSATDVSGRVSGNSFSASGATTNNIVRYSGANGRFIDSASTGNIVGPNNTGTCNGTATTGSVQFTSGLSC